MLRKWNRVSMEVQTFPASAARASLLPEYSCRAWRRFRAIRRLPTCCWRRLLDARLLPVCSLELAERRCLTASAVVRVVA